MTINKTIKIFLLVHILFLMLITPKFASAQDIQLQTQAIEEQAETEIPPLLRVNVEASLLNRNSNFGMLASGSASLDARWAMGSLRIRQGIISDRDEFSITEFSGYAHLLAIGISNFSYRRYLSGRETRILGGFSYTQHIRDVMRVDVNIGLAYFDTNLVSGSSTQYGFQLGARIISNYWRIHNEFSISGYQNVKLNEAGVDLSGTKLSCDVGSSTIDCVVPPRSEDPESYTGVNIISWEHTGVILEEDMFINAYQTNNCQFGPSLTFRYENLPVTGVRIWVLAGFRLVWTS